jgi:hypothetical protein
MNHREVAVISNTFRALERINELNQRFLEHATQYSTAQELETKLDINGVAIQVCCFGHTAEAKSRIVKDKNGEFTAEYLFLVQRLESAIEVWRFYLISNGRLSDDPEGTNTLCDFNNLAIARNICWAVITGMLNSELFTPSVAKDG